MHPSVTILELGVVRIDFERSFVIADIPGLIAGAHEGRGLGDRFLGHVERCSVLLHLVDGCLNRAMLPRASQDHKAPGLGIAGQADLARVRHRSLRRALDAGLGRRHRHPVRRRPRSALRQTPVDGPARGGRGDARDPVFYASQVGS